MSMKPDWLTPVPSVFIDGTRIPVTLEEVNPGAGLVLDDFAISWGVRELFGETEPSRLSLTILDLDGTWFTPARLAGADIDVRATWLQEFNQPSSERSRTVFRGQITDAQAEPVNLASMRAGEVSWRVTLTCIDRLGQLGNTMVNRGAKYGNVNWSTTEIAGFIQAASGGIVRLETTQEETWPGGDLTHESALTLTHEIYRAWGETAHYYPEENVIRGVSNAVDNFTSGSWIYQEFGSWTIGNKRPYYVPGWGVQPMITMPADRLGTTAALTSGLSQAITRVTVTDTEEQSTTLAVTTPASRRIGTRTLFRQIRARLKHMTLAQIIQRSYQISGWQPEPAPVTRIHTRFNSSDEIKAFLTPAPSGLLVTVNGSVWRGVDEDWPGVFDIRAGTIRWRKKQWEITSELTLQGMDWSRITPLTFDSLAQAGQGRGRNITFAAMNRSVAAGDFRSVDRIH